MLQNIDNYLATFIDKAHLDYVQEHLPNKHKLSFFLPHGGLVSGQNTPNAITGSISNLEEFKQQKTLDLVFSGSFMSKTEKTWQAIDNFPSYILDEASEEIIYNDKISIHEAFYKVCNKYGIKFSEKHKVNLEGIFYELNSYTRSYKRQELIKQLAKAGLNITICGNGWKNFASQYENINYLGALNVEENLNLIKKAKVLVNITPSFNHGSHERVFTGMLNNTVVFSDKSSYYDNYYTNKEDILYYSFTTMNEDINSLKALLEDDEKMFSMTQQAYQITQKHHTWNNRATQILEMLSLAKTMN